MTRKRTKTVRAWAIVTADGRIIPGLICHDRASVKSWLNLEGSRIACVEIREVNARRDGRCPDCGQHHAGRC